MNEAGKRPQKSLSSSRSAAKTAQELRLLRTRETWRVNSRRTILVMLFCSITVLVPRATLVLGQGPSKAEPSSVHTRYGLPAAVLKGPFHFAGETIPISRADVQYRILSQVNFLLLDARSVLTRWLADKSRHAWIFETVLAKEGVPRDLVLLAPVLTGRKSAGPSRSGGVGWWTLSELCKAGDGIEMAQDSWHDDRWDPDLSTRCFALKLKAIKKELGDTGWLMTVAGYLASTKTIQALEQKWNTTVFWDLPLPDDAEELVVRWVALGIIDGNREHFGLKVKEAPPIAFDQISGVVLSKDLSVAEIARLTDTPPREILELNPKIRHGRAVFPSSVDGKPATHSLAAPRGKGQTLVKKLKEAGYLEKSAKE